MKRNLVLSLVVIFALSAGLSAATKITNFTATADVGGFVNMTVSISNSISPTIFNFGSFAGGVNIPVIATNAGKPTFAKVVYDLNYPSWKLVVFNDNRCNVVPKANPRYVGDGNEEGGNINDGTGLISDDLTGTNIHSSPMQVWADVKMPNGTLALAPCPYWVGLGSLYGVPKPLNETGLPWKAQDLNSDGDSIDAITTGFLETDPANHPNIDVNGDGDFMDVVDGTTNNSWSAASGTANHLRQVFEYSCWRWLTKESSAGVPVLMSDTLAYGVGHGSFKTYFAITDDVAGALKTSKLVFELITY